MRETLVKTEEFKDSPLGKIPKDWDVCPLKDLTDSPDSITYGVLKPGEYIPDGIPLLQIQDVIHGKIEPSKLHRISKGLDAQYARTRLYGGEIVMSLVGTIGKIAQIPDSMAGANLHRNLARIPVARGNSSRFVFHYLQSQTVQEAIAATTFGSTQSLLNLTDLRELLVAVPPPQEQQTIAHIIDTIDSTIAHTSSLIAKLKQMKAGLLHDLLTRGLDENGELRDAIGHPEQFKDSPLGRIPKSWQCDVARAFCNDIVVGVVCSATDSYVKHGVPFLRSQNIRPNSIDTNGLLYISPSFNILQSKSILHADDVVIVRTGYPGTAAVVPDELEGANCFSLIVARPNRTILNSYFFAQYINSEGCQASIERAHFGSAQHNFNIAEMDKLLIAVPPLTEQTEIVCRIEALDTRIRSEEAYRDQLKLQKQGLMHDLLTGKVQVKDADKFTPCK